MHPAGVVGATEPVYRCDRDAWTRRLAGSDHETAIGAGSAPRRWAKASVANCGTDGRAGGQTEEIAQLKRLSQADSSGPSRRSEEAYGPRGGRETLGDLRVRRSWKAAGATLSSRRRRAWAWPLAAVCALIAMGIVTKSFADGLGIGAAHGQDVDPYGCGCNLTAGSRCENGHRVR